MRKAKLLMALIILTGLMGCTTTRIETRKDEFDGSIVNEMKGNVLASRGILDLTVVGLNARQRILKDGFTTYSLKLAYHADNWLFLEGSLILLVDGQRMQLRPISRPLRKVNGGLGLLAIYEIRKYDITPEQLREIAYADCVKVKITGAHHYIIRKFTKSNISNYRHFYEKYVKDKP